MFSKLDLQAGFHQLRLQDGDQEKTALSAPFGLFEWVTCPFGLANTLGGVKSWMTDILREHIVAGYYCVYTDDILIFTESDDPAEHMLKLEAVLETLRTNELLVKGAKWELFRTEVEFLGFKISPKDWAPTESKIATVVEWQARSNTCAHSWVWPISSSLSLFFFQRWQRLSQICSKIQQVKEP